MSTETLVKLTHDKILRATFDGKDVWLQVRIGSQIGEGAEARVFQADVQDASGEINRQVALKIYQLPAQYESPAFWRQVELWKRVNHAGLAPLLGIVYIHADAGLIGLMSPWASRGNVANMRANATASAAGDVTNVAKDVAESLAYLHGAGIVHGDVKAENVLVADDGRAVLADFGLSTYVTQQENRTRTDMRIKHTTRFAAPELLEDAAYGPLSSEPPRSKTTYSDMYAFGGLLYQLHTGHAPWHDTDDNGVIVAVTSGKLPQRPGPGEGVPLSDEMWKLCLQCWDRDPRRRPTANEVVQTLDNLPVN